jgi:hypothetical protein
MTTTNTNTNNFVSIAPVGNIYFGRGVLFDNIVGSGRLKFQSESLPTTYKSLLPAIKANGSDNTNQSESVNSISTACEFLIITLPIKKELIIFQDDIILDKTNIEYNIIINVSGKVQDTGDTDFKISNQRSFTYSDRSGFKEIDNTYSILNDLVNESAFNIIPHIDTDTKKLDVIIFNKSYFTILWDVSIKVF